MTEENVLEKLRELTDNLPPVPNTQLRYDSTRASGMGFGLINTPELCVQRTLMFEGLKLYAHTHKGREWAIVIDGSCIVRWGDNEKECKTGDYIAMDPGVEHSVEATEDTWLLLITVPGDQEEYPDGIT